MSDSRSESPREPDSALEPGSGSDAGEAQLLDVPRLAAWLDAQGLEPGAPIAHERIVAGEANEMFRIRRGAGHWVLRRPAAVAIERAADGMRREYRLLHALKDTGVPHARAIALCDDAAVLGCVFYLMEAVDGFAAVDPLPKGFDDAQGRRGLAFALVDALAALHAVDWRACGLGDFGRPEGFHERQVSRWMKQLAGYGEGRELPGLVEVGRWLEANRPAADAWTPTLMHADYHMLNVLMAPDLPPRVAAIVDWETATIGDPLLDFAGFLRIWCSFRKPPEWPSQAELIERYTQQSGRPVVDLHYYAALYHFRLAVLLEGVYRRSLADPTRKPSEQAGQFALRNAEQASAIAEGRDEDLV